jgi:choline dehydrogenase-like flavoprotein
VTPTLDAPVLIAGGGPTGLVLASLLAANGVNCLLAERSPSTTRFPKMDIAHGPSMELLRRLGVDQELRRIGVASQFSFDVIFAPGLNGPEVGRWRRPSVDEQRAVLANSVDGSRPGQPWQISLCSSGPICTSPGAAPASPMRRRSSAEHAARRDRHQRHQHHSQEHSP